MSATEKMTLKQQVVAATMKDVALKANVSTATVSRALMNPVNVAQATRNRVEQAALEIGYLPHGRNSQPRPSPVILVMAPDICDPFFSEIIRGIEITAARARCLVLLSHCALPQQKEPSFSDMMISRQIDGMLLLSSRLPFDAGMAERRTLPPMVMLNEFVPELNIPTVHIDNLSAAFNAVNHLLQRGHKRIACIAGAEDIPLCRYRLQGYVQALRRRGIAVDPRFIARGLFTCQSGAQAMARLLQLPQRPSAVFCHSDIMALGALAQARRSGLRVPADLSIVGFDNIALAEFCDPPLTTVAQPCFEIGRQAMLLLLDKLQGKHVNGGSHLLECELIVRDSTQVLT